MKWSELGEIQRNALVAEKVMGWQWIPYTFYDAAPPDDQLWLLPDGQSVACLTSGEWTYYLDEPEIYPEGSVFPLPHKDNRHIPYWIPRYTTSMDAAWLVVEKILDKVVFTSEVGDWSNESKYVVITFGRTLSQDEIRTAAATMPEAICIAALKTVGVEIG